MGNAEKKLCMGCMEEKSKASVCPYCGFDENKKSDKNAVSPGTDLDSRYIIGELKRSNGEGLVYLGYDKQEQEPVWIKEYFPRNIASRNPNTFEITPNSGSGAQYKALLSDFIELFNEIRRIEPKEPVLPTENLIGENNTIYVVNKYIESLSLEEYLIAAGGKISPEETMKLLIPLLNGIDNIHMKGIIHRGLSPHTIFVDYNRLAYIDGFALSATRTGGSELKAELFNGYSAPEQYLSTGWQGTWTDVYSLGAIFYRAISGIVPPKSTRASEKDFLSPLENLGIGINSSISDAVESAMTTITHNRTQTVAAFLSDLLSEAGVPRTEIFNIGRLPVNIEEKEEVIDGKSDYNKEIKPLDLSGNSSTEDFFINFEDETISQPVSELFEYSNNQKQQPLDNGVAENFEFYEPEQPTKRIPKRLIFALIGIAVLIGIILAVILSNKLGRAKDNSKKTSSTQRPETVQAEEASATEESSQQGAEPEVNLVPDLVGKKLSSIEFNKEYTDIYIFTVKEEYIEGIEAGIIAEQVPKAGTELPRKGGTIVLTVSKGELKMIMPDLAGKEPEEALQDLAKMALEMNINFEDMKIKQVEKYQANAEAGKIISTSPAPETEFNPLEEDIQIYIALAPPTSQSQQQSSPQTSSSTQSPSGTTSGSPSRGPNGTDGNPHVLPR